MAFALFISGIMSWYTWRADIHIADMQLPFGVFSADILVMEQRPLTLGGVEVSLWIIGILLVAGSVWLWKKCSEWTNAAVHPTA